MNHQLCRSALFTLLMSVLPLATATAGDDDAKTTQESHGHHDHAAMMAAMEELPAVEPALLPDASIYQLDAELSDQHGNTLRFADLGGEVRLVSMFYASCKYVCPLIIDQIKRIERELDDAQRQRLRVSMISFDARRDSPGKLQALATERHVDGARWQLLRPAPGDVRPISALLGIQYRELPDGEFNHASVISLIDAEGRIVARTEQLGARPDPAFVDAVRAALEGSEDGEAAD